MPYTAEQEAIRAELADWSRQHGLTVADLAGFLGYSESVASQFCTGNYAGDVARVARKARAFLDRAYAEAAAIREPAYLPTAPAQTICGTLHNASIGHRMAFICAVAGTGKTWAARAYAAAHPDDCLLITAIVGSTALGILRRLADALGMQSDGLARDKLFDGLAARLRERGGPLIILDEADHAQREALQVIRQLRDLSGCGLAILCTPALFSALRAKPQDRDAQLVSRVVYNPVIGSLSEQDAEALCAHFGLGADARAIAVKGAGGNARRLVNALIVAAEIAKAAKTPIEPRYVAAGYAAQTRAAVA